MSIQMPKRIYAPHLKTVFWGSNFANLSLILLCWTRNPMDLKKPAMKLYPYSWMISVPYQVSCWNPSYLLSHTLSIFCKLSISKLHSPLLSFSRWILVLKVPRAPQQEFYEMIFHDSNFWVKIICTIPKTNVVAKFATVYVICHKKLAHTAFNKPICLSHKNWFHYCCFCRCKLTNFYVTNIFVY